MILINLLPHREMERRRRRQAFNRVMLVAVLAGFALAALIYASLQARIAEQQERNGLLRTEIQSLEQQIKEIATLEEEIGALQARQKAVEGLQGDRNLPVHLLNELVRQLPDGVYLTSLRQAGEVVTLQGMAQSNERISQLLRNLAGAAPWIARPELMEIVAATVALGPRDQRRVASFSLRFHLVRGDAPQDGAAPDARKRTPGA
ncbi:PilN domain-containing protein [Melaminivora sp.]|uniref:PilN domain-containing protein n=1 Tax=Melaminivora sp. TaxID=1933032 RepID=UPI0028A8CFD9|nr:PilN domain-containing protein [Melaminivora sp.]